MSNPAINNIKKAILEKRFNDKVMPNDHVVTKEEREEHILNFDSTKKRFSNKFKGSIANIFVNKATKKINKTTQIVGGDSIQQIKTGAVITCNHFHPVDSTIVRHFTNKLGKKNKLDIMVTESNIFMKGKLGWVLRNTNVIPICSNNKYIQHSLFPSIEKLLNKNRFVLIYPEQEMWFNYIKPRPLKSGAYHLAAKNNVPIIPCFVEMQVGEGENVNYILHVGDAIYPDKKKSLVENKNQMQKEDYDFKVKTFEKAYNKKLKYDYEEGDILFAK